MFVLFLDFKLAKGNIMLNDNIIQLLHFRLKMVIYYITKSFYAYHFMFIVPHNNIKGEFFDHSADRKDSFVDNNASNLHSFFVWETCG